VDGAAPAPGEEADPARRGVVVTKAPGMKCARCWRVLPEVGTVTAHPTLCLRCADAVESGLVCRAAAE
jgi:isoleucyl-tRNA synthetase